MKLTPPKVVTWWVAVALGVFGLIGHSGSVAGLSAYSFWLVTAGLVLMALATLLKKL